MYPVCKQSNFHWVSGTPCHITSIYSVQLYYLEILLIFFSLIKPAIYICFIFFFAIFDSQCFKAHILVQCGKIYIVFVLHDGFRIRIMFSLFQESF